MGKANFHRIDGGSGQIGQQRLTHPQISGQGAAKNTDTVFSATEQYRSQADATVYPENWNATLKSQISQPRMDGQCI